jgi:uncharacterized hydrophobic protein (TIGR00271 family)
MPNSSDPAGKKEDHSPFSVGKAWGRIRQDWADLLTISHARKDEVRSEIADGSSPGSRYYILLSIAALISALGLLTNSPAVIIGAMLISPLMTPIFGISLGLVSGRPLLVRKALMSEFGGVALTVLAGLIVGKLPLYFHVTGEMLARTKPTLLDLGVATLAGLAGCLAMIVEKISPVLPGIAIATSLVPPLATTGLCLAFGAYEGAWGSFLLFFANFLAILIVSGLMFIGAGFVRKSEMPSKLNITRQFSSAILSLIVVCIFLTRALISVVDQYKTSATIESLLNEALAVEPATTLEEFKFKKNLESIDILAVLRAARPLSPSKVKEIETRLGDALELRPKLVVRCTIVKDISATGSTSVVIDTNLDGTFITDRLTYPVKRFQLAEQALREVLDSYPGLFLREVEFIRLEEVPIVIATIESSSAINAAHVKGFEQAIQLKLQDPEVRLLVRSADLVGVTRKGRVLFGKAHLSKLPRKEALLQDQVENSVFMRLRALKDIYPLNVDAIRRGEGWQVRAEVVSPQTMSPQEVGRIEKEVSKDLKLPVQLEVWLRQDILISGAGFAPKKDYAENDESRGDN